MIDEREVDVMSKENQGTTPLVTVIMPAYNAERFIEEAIMSVVNQTLTDWELLVIDDCSKDASVQIAQKIAAKDSRIQVFENDVNSGVAKTRNRGIDMAKGRYIAFLDSDDVWLSKKLECQLERMSKANSEIGYCSYGIIGVDGTNVRADYIVPETAIFKDILKENYIQCSAMLIRADILKSIKFNTEYFHEDYILGLDMLRTGAMAVGCSEVLLNWRYLENSRSFNKKKSALNRWRIYRHYLKFSFFKSAYLFVGYMTAGLRKYLRKPKKFKRI